VGYHQHRKVATLAGVVGLSVPVWHCPSRGGARDHRAYRPEEEGRIVRPHDEYGLDVRALLGALRYRPQQTVIELHREVLARGVSLSQRHVTDRVEGYEERVARALGQAPERRARLQAQGRLIRAIEGRQPEVGHEGLWGGARGSAGRDCWLAACSPRPSRSSPPRWREAVAGREVAVTGGSDGQPAIRQGVARAFPGVAHQLCHCHYRRQAAGPRWAADRHAKTELKQPVRPIRAVAGREDAEAESVQSDCAAVRSA
jgi:hypothetical protein